jgi:cytochrome bd-type quinol oxidase subunit 1
MRIAGFNLIDFLAGLFITAIGAYGVWEAMTFPLGTLNRMGPGYFPLCLGILLIVLGFGIMFVEGRSRQEEEKPPRRVLRALLFIPAGISAFGFLIEWAGLLPAVIAAVLISTLADPSNRPTSVLVLAAALSIFCVAVFIEMLGVPMRVLKWGP